MRGGQGDPITGGRRPPRAPIAGGKDRGPGLVTWDGRLSDLPGSRVPDHAPPGFMGQYNRLDMGQRYSLWRDYYDRSTGRRDRPPARRRRDLIGAPPSPASAPPPAPAGLDASDAALFARVRGQKKQPPKRRPPPQSPPRPPQSLHPLPPLRPALAQNAMPRATSLPS